MAIPTNKAWMATGLGIVLLAATVALCLAYTSFREGPSLSLRDLEDSQTVLMSCAREEGPRSSAELLWCADSDSPACSPALPISGHLELSDSPLFALSTVPGFGSDDRKISDLPRWQRPPPEAGPPSGIAVRLERPPRI